VITGDPAETIQKVAASANCGKIISIYEYNLYTTFLIILPIYRNQSLLG
jgi:hypothetical protein